MRITNSVTEPADLALVTPTRDRPLAFSYCERWMRRQTFPGTVLWIVVDDGDVPAITTMGQLHVRREPSSETMTLPDNLAAAIPYLKEAPAVAIIEDDDWYRPDYVETVVHWTRDCGDLCGIKEHIYYNLQTFRFAKNKNFTHASLCTTSFRASFLPVFERIVMDHVRTRKPFVDLSMWGEDEEKRFHHMDGDRIKKYLSTDNLITIGLKGWPGRGNIGCGGSLGMRFPCDCGCVNLKQWLGKEDAVEVVEEIQKWRRSFAGMAQSRLSQTHGVIDSMIPHRDPPVAAPSS